MKRSLSKRGGEKGMATVLVMLLVGTAITATTLGTMYTLRSTQDTQRSLHANTGSEALAWNGVEMVRAYVQRVSEKIAEANASGATPPIADLSQLPARLIGSSSSSDEPISAVITQAYSASSRELTVQVTGRTSNASTTIEVVLYVGDPTVSGTTVANKSVLTFRDGLAMGGGISIDTDAGKQYVINVDGDAVIGSISIRGQGGLSEINTTGSLKLTSGSISNTLEKVAANCDVMIESVGNPQINNIYATNNICLQNNINTRQVIANGSIHVKGGSHIALKALANRSSNGATCSSTGTTFCSISNTKGVTLDPSPSVTDILSKADVESSSTVKGAPSIAAEANITLTGSTYGTLRAGQNILLQNGETAASATSGGTLTAANGGAFGPLKAGGEIKLTNATASSILSASAVSLTNSSVSGTVNAKGNINLDNLVPPYTIQGEANLTVSTSTAAHWENIAGAIAGTANNNSVSLCTAPGANPWYCTNFTKLTQNASVTVPFAAENFTLDLAEVTPVTIDTDYFDANQMRNAANYIFRRKDNQTRVSVRGVTNIPTFNGSDGLGYYVRARTVNNSEEQDWLCQTATASASDGTACLGRIASWGGKGTDKGSNKTIDYDSGEGSWLIGGGDSAIVPGVLFFEGSLTVKSGTFYNTFIATHNITTAGNTTVYAPNFVGYAKICNHPLYSVYQPTDFCEDSAYLSSALSGIGNYAFLAGSCATYSGDTCTSYVGGNIELRQKNDIYGAVKAGNQFTSTGSSTIHGFITALALTGNAENSLGASTSIDLTNLPEGYDPTGGSLEGLIETSTGPDTVKVLWARYL